MKRFLACTAVLFSFAASLSPTMANAAWPDKPIKFVVPFPAGSTTDVVTRQLAGELTKSLGQPIVIENSVGADGIIAAQAVKRAANDGYTMLVSTNSAHGTNKALYRSLPYDPEKDFDAVSGIIKIPYTLLVRKDFPANDVATFMKVGQQRSATKPLSFGTGNTSTLVGAHLIKSAGKFEILAVPYRGTPQVVQDLLAGQIEVAVSDPNTSMPFLQSGQLKALAMLDSARHPLLPNVPTMEDAGYKGMELVTWVALFAPAKTDPAIVDRLNREINNILVRAGFKESMMKFASQPLVLTPSETRAFVASEIVRWGHYVELAGIPKNN